MVFSFSANSEKLVKFFFHYIDLALSYYTAAAAADDYNGFGSSLCGWGVRAELSSLAKSRATIRASLALLPPLLSLLFVCWLVGFVVSWLLLVAIALAQSLAQSHYFLKLSLFIINGQKNKSFSKAQLSVFFVWAACSSAANSLQTAQLSSSPHAFSRF